LEGSFVEKLMEDGALDATALPGGKEGFGGGIVAMGVGGSEEADAVEGCAGSRGDVNAEFGEGSEGVGHEAFATCFVDGGCHAVGDLYGEATESSGDGSGKSSRPCAGDEDVSGWRGRIYEGLLCCNHRRDRMNKVEGLGCIGPRYSIRRLRQSGKCLFFVTYH
jgi:hypothetical protein